jgi:hypothetical protein
MKEEARVSDLAVNLHQEIHADEEVAKPVEKVATPPKSVEKVYEPKLPPIEEVITPPNLVENFALPTE